MLELYQALNASHPIYDPIGDRNGYKVGARFARVQIMIALFLGISAFTLFCILRRWYPRIYAANSSPSHASLSRLYSGNRQGLPKLPSTFLGWVPVVYKISEEQVLEQAGLDAVVFLGFFKTCIKALATCVFFALTVISPIRYWFTGRVDMPGDDDGYHDLPPEDFISVVSKHKHKFKFEQFLWMYTVFTYVFTFIVLWFIYKQTAKIINMRQQYLGKQSSITDRTIKLLGIPPMLREEETLKRHINSLGVGEVDTVSLVKEWNVLNLLFSQRESVIYNLEALWVEYFQINGIKQLETLVNAHVRPSGEVFNLRGQNPGDLADGVESTEDLIDFESNQNSTNETYPRRYQDSPDISNEQSHWNEPLLTDPGNPEPSNNTEAQDAEDSVSISSQITTLPGRPMFRSSLFGPKVDKISHFSAKLQIIDKEIKRYRNRDFPCSSTAFVTMNSVAQAQMLAQAVLDPKVDHLITSLAPSPHDIIWENLCLTRRERNARIFLVMVFIGLVSALLVFPVRFLTNFLNLKLISKIAPRLAQFLEAHKWAETLITGILPPYVFTIFNVVIPHFYIWITSHQGYTSRGDEELSSVSKNFFYIFVNLFLAFTLFGTATLTDTAQLAYQLADSLKKLSLFYVDLIILQGIGMFPFKLLLLGNLLKYPLGNIFWCKTPRDYLQLHKPPVFNFGLNLPQPILIVIITVTYSVISTKILSAGLVYFLIGYFVFKYQLLYACVHPPHNTGKVWPLVVRRVIMGILIFHTMMIGTLASEKAYACATAIIPLLIFTIYILWQYQNQYIPLSNFIALRSIENNQLPYHDEENALYPVSTRAQTLDERREINQNYLYPNLVCELEGPLIAIEGDEVLYVGLDGNTIMRKINLD